jgi:hypothetical protein
MQVQYGSLNTFFIACTSCINYYEKQLSAQLLLLATTIRLVLNLHDRMIHVDVNRSASRDGCEYASLHRNHHLEDGFRRWLAFL